jgi:hypothetical protein
MPMGLVGLAAPFANALTVVLLWVYRSGDSNMQSVWLCSRNDVIGNCAVLLAAAGVFGTAQGWPASPKNGQYRIPTAALKCYAASSSLPEHTLWQD